MNSKRDQFKNHIKKINKLSSIFSSIVGLIAAVVFFFLGKELLEQVFFQCVTVLALVLILIHLKANNLKQKAIIRYMTDSIGDIDI